MEVGLCIITGAQGNTAIARMMAVWVSPVRSPERIRPGMDKVTARTD
jgi:hypothetical protein